MIFGCMTVQLAGMKWRHLQGDLEQTVILGGEDPSVTLFGAMKTLVKSQISMLLHQVGITQFHWV